MSHARLRMGMVGGGKDAFIGAVHRTAACLDHQAAFVAGALSSTPEKSIASGRELGLADGRNYPSWRAMLDGELSLAPSERIDFVSIVTPNDTHFEIARAFASAGFNVVCDKPLVHTSDQARELIRAVESTGVVFAVTYNYSGYPLVKHARHMVATGAIGAVRKVIVEYNQGWLATNLESTGQKQADWRTDPKRSGAGGAIGDIGSHAEQLLCYITGLEIDAICADLCTFVAGRKLDDDANLLLRLRPPHSPALPTPSRGTGVAPQASAPAAIPSARGVLIASQVEIGHENDLGIRVFGTSGSLEWRQEDPNQLVHRPLGEPERVLRRGNAYLCEAAKRNTRIPAGHPEAFLEAFANIYAAAFTAMRQRAAGVLPAQREQDFPNVNDGARGVKFIETTIASGRSEAKWTPVDGGV
ncbi:MAG: Gfo/Idh/MocA family protein [Phycisphaerales bacterium]